MRDAEEAIDGTADKGVMPKSSELLGKTRRGDIADISLDEEDPEETCTAKAGSISTLMSAQKRRKANKTRCRSSRTVLIVQETLCKWIVLERNE